MASLMEDLIDVLNKEEEQYQGLIELGKKKREVVIQADIKTLDEITATEQEVASNLQNLAKKRTRVLNDMATVLGRNPGEVTITKMISYLEEQPVEQKQLMEVKERLLQTGKEMAAINEQNEILLNQRWWSLTLHCLRVCDRQLRPPTIIRTPAIQVICLAAVALTQNSNM